MSDKIITEGADFEEVCKFFPRAKAVQICPATGNVWASCPNGSRDVRATKDWTYRLGTCAESCALRDRLLAG